MGDLVKDIGRKYETMEIYPLEPFSSKFYLPDLMTPYTIIYRT